MAVVNPMLTPMFNPNVKDSRWLTLEVCREFQRTKCSRTENECKFAHPPPHVEVQNGRVTCCFDSIKGKCQRKEPPCKYLHPPQHLREQLLQNGRNNLILKNLQMQYIAAGLQPTMLPFPTQADQTTGQNSATSPEYRASPNPASYYTYEQVPPYIVSQTAGAATFGGAQYSIPTVGGASVPTMLSVDAGAAAAAAAAAAAGSMGTPTTQVLTSVNSSTAGGGGGSGASTKITRPDRLENNMGGGLAGMMPVIKRPALDTKSGIPMYQPNAATTAAAYQQAFAMQQLQQQQQPFVPVSNTSAAAAAVASAAAALRQQPTIYGTYSSPYLDNVAGHPPSVQRF